MAQQDSPLPNATVCDICADFAKCILQVTGKRVKVKGGARRVESTRWTEGRDVFRHHDSHASLVKSADAGCGVCSLIADDFKADGPNGTYSLKLYCFQNNRPVEVVATFEEAKYSFWYFGMWEPHVFHIVKHRPYDTEHETVLDGHGKQVGNPERFYRALPARSDSKDAFDTARYWLQTCNEGHKSCGDSPEAPLPTRVIDIGQPPEYNAVPRLLITTEEEEGYYVALSHCWGGDIPCKLTQDVLEQYRKALPMDQLPRNFVDAVRVARELGFRYIWIDALCIIQDSASDWQSEAAKMADIYSQAALTISAMSSDASTKGFLGPRQRKHVQIHEELAVCGQEPRITDIIEQCSLDNRGWCMQERLLSKKLLHYTKDQMMWECAQGLTLEQSGMHESIGVSRERIYDTFISDFIKLRLDYHSHTTKFDYTVWYGLVEEYRTRDLTMATDTLPAIAGVASRFNTLMTRYPGAFIAGLWENDLKRGLFWGPKPKIERNTRTAVKRHFFQLSRPADLARYPSWSWASVQGCVEFWMKEEHATNEKYQRRQDFKILSVNVALGYDDLMATQVKAELRIRASMTRAWYNYEHDEGYYGHPTQFYKSTDGDSLEEPCSDLNCLLDTERDKPRDIWIVTSVGPPDYAYMLALEKIEEDRFRRIGLVYFPRAFDPEEWSRFQVKEFTLI
ncbi:heterokaryon incompatibility protein-domain-containing protein [Stachybotrys elegans]|uniref:Heterokaryon incompatibility protein-domain-containing protein n=1 Tax=Stachybotrys elegans TaxID=80388 RepID=A0A8K0SL76_9HYPO|nr:heterokaryon incompatibility protein-domain-containing protein [Stachybotrys elegans]